MFEWKRACSVNISNNAFFRITNTIGSELFPQQWFFGVSKTRWLTKADFADKPVCNRATNISVCISIFIESRERWVVYRIRNKRIDLSYSEKNKQIVTALKLLIDIRCSLKIIRLMNTHTHARTATFIGQLKPQKRVCPNIDATIAYAHKYVRLLFVYQFGSLD